MTEKNQNKHISRLNIALSILVAFGAWLYVVSFISPDIQKTYNNVDITCQGTDTLAIDGLGVESLSKDQLSVTVKIPRSEVGKISSDDIKAVVDVSNASEGNNTCEIKVTMPLSNMTLVTKSMDDVTVSIEESSNVDVPVAACYSDNGDASEEPLIKQIDSSMVSVMGAASQVKKVSYVLLDVTSLADTSKTKTVIGKPYAIDDDGNIVKNIVVRPETVEIKYTAGTVKEVPLTVDVTDNDNETLSYNLPSSVYIKGTADAVKKVSKITATFDASGVYSSQTVNINYNLPEGIELANKSLDTGISVKVK